MTEELNLQKDLGALKEDMSKLRSDISEITRKLVDLGKIEAGAAREKLLERSRKMADTVEKKIEERPIMSLLVAFIVGLLLGSLSGLVSRK
jgi:ElaB/YqjD/DUF883 family membrane-anchored ribosome-binding protein